MATLTLDELIESVERLSPEEQQLLVERVTADLREKRDLQGKRPRWEDAAGIARYPLCGEDAQTWVGRTRAESDERLRRW